MISVVLIPTPVAPVFPFAPVIHTGEVSVAVPLDNVVFVLDHIYLPSDQVGTVVSQLPPACVVLDVER